MTEPAPTPVDPIEASALKARIYTQIRPDLERIEAELHGHLDSSIPLIGVIGRHIMGSGGKRLRPLLMVLSARLCGYQGNHDASLAVSLEFLHAATLLHDDVVDNAELRRARPAANTVWGNPAAVLVGDFLYSKSVLMTVGYQNLRILEVFSDTTTRMAEGEVLQLMHSDNLEIDEPGYFEVIRRKTAVLMSAACRIGGIFGGGSSDQEKALGDYGHHLGIAFQLTDDALDYMGDRNELGKPVGNDLREGKATLPLIHAMRTAKPEDRRAIQRVFGNAAASPEAFETVRRIVHGSGGIEYTLQRASEHIATAKTALSIFPEHPSRGILLDIADYVLCRKT